LFVIPWVFGCLGISTFAAPRPNIILIFCDDYNGHRQTVHARLDAMVDAGLEWSGTLMDPQWHDTRQGLITWRERDMPQYPRTFQRR